MSTKNIATIQEPGRSHFVGDGFRVVNFIPGNIGMQRMDPFIMMDYNEPVYFPPTDRPRGVGVHPHRGFETVTIAYKGKVAHNDSSGNSGVIGEGDVQWMTAASGILHKEYHEENFSKKGGKFQMVQLWVNLPAKDKMSKPKYQEITNDKIGKYQIPNDGGTIEVIAGDYKNIKGAASTFTPVYLLNAKLNIGATETFSFPAHYNTSLLVIEGHVKVNDQTIAANHFVVFENKGEEFTIEALENSIVLVLSGEPINEPIAVNGPFIIYSSLEEGQPFK